MGSDFIGAEFAFVLGNTNRVVPPCLAAEGITDGIVLLPVGPADPVTVNRPADEAAVVDDDDEDDDGAAVDDDDEDDDAAIDDDNELDC
jgi:hypothetical protein